MVPGCAENSANSFEKLVESLNHIELFERSSRKVGWLNPLRGSLTAKVAVKVGGVSESAFEGGAGVSVGAAKYSAKAVAVKTTATCVATLFSKDCDGGVVVVQEAKKPSTIKKKAGK